MEKVIEMNEIENNDYIIQYEYAKQYTKQNRIVKFIAVFTIILIITSVILLVFLPIIGLKLNYEYEYILASITGLFVFISAILILIFSRCPKCGKLQPSDYVEIGINPAEVSYGRGVTPFRKRCFYCSTYLSLEKLDKDMKSKKRA